MEPYRHFVVDELPDAPSPTDRKKEIDEAVGATEFGLNLFVAQSGQRLPWGYHAHPAHEETIYALDGRVFFETPAGDVTVEPAEVFFVPTDAPQLGRAVGDEPTRVLAMGAPKQSDQAIIQEECHLCGAVAGRNAEVLNQCELTVKRLACDACD